MTVNAACDCSAYKCGACERWSAMINCLHLWRVAVFCACVHCLRDKQSFASYFNLVYCATLRDFTSWMKRLHFCYYCVDVCSILVHFWERIQWHTPVSGVGVSQFSWRAMFTRPISCARSTVTVCGNLLHSMHWCITHYKQAVCSELWPVKLL